MGTMYMGVWKENVIAFEISVSSGKTESKISPWKVLGQNNKFSKTTLYSFQLLKISYIEVKCKLWLFHSCWRET